jgi:lysophospholipase L1-like esterase
MTLKKTIPLLPVAGAAVVASQILYAAHRPDLPSYDNNETSGTFGDPGLPGLSIVALGDSSITAPGVQHADDSFIRRVATSLTDRHFVNLQSLAVGGAKITEVRADQLSPALAASPDLTVISIGANDAIRGVPARAFRADLDHMTSSLLAVGSMVVIVGIGDLGSIPRLPRFLRWYLTYRSGHFDRISGEVAAGYPGAVKADVRGDLSRAFWEEEAMFSADLFHASSYGHDHFATHVSEAVEKALTAR